MPAVTRSIIASLRSLESLPFVKLYPKRAQKNDAKKDVRHAVLGSEYNTISDALNAPFLRSLAVYLRLTAPKKIIEGPKHNKIICNMRLFGNNAPTTEAATPNSRRAI